MGSKNMSALMRPVDWHYPTNRAIILIALGVFVSGTAFQVFQGTAFLTSAGWGLSAGLAVFLAWALTRELDPDHDLAAFVAAVLTLAGIVIWGLNSSLLLMLWLIEAVRVLNRSVGLPVQLFDSLLLLGLGGWMVWQGYPEVGALTAVVFFVDDRLNSHSRQAKVMVWLSLLLSLGLTLLRPSERLELGTGLPLAMIAGLVVSGALFTWVIGGSHTPRAVCDVGGSRLHGACVQAGQILGLVTAVVFVARYGQMGFDLALPLWAALLGAGLFRLGRTVFGSFVDGGA